MTIVLYVFSYYLQAAWTAQELHIYNKLPTDYSLEFVMKGVLPHDTCIAHITKSEDETVITVEYDNETLKQDKQVTDAFKKIYGQMVWMVQYSLIKGFSNYFPSVTESYPMYFFVYGYFLITNTKTGKQYTTPELAFCYADKRDTTIGLFNVPTVIVGSTLYHPVWQDIDDFNYPEYEFVGGDMKWLAPDAYLYDTGTQELGILHLTRNDCDPTKINHFSFHSNYKPTYEQDSQQFYVDLNPFDYYDDPPDE